MNTGIDSLGLYASSFPVFSPSGEGIALIETRASATETDRAVRSLIWRLILTAFVFAALALVAGVLLGRRVTRPTEALTDAAIRLGQGDFAQSIPTDGPAEPRRVPWGPIGLVVALMFLAGCIGWVVSSRSESTSLSTVDRGFVADMSDHHDQAVEMALYELANGEDPVALDFAMEVVLLQRQELGQMAVLMEQDGMSRPALDPDRVVALRRVGDAVFKQPVKIGDALHVEGEITRTRELDSEHGLVEAGLRIVNQHGRLAVRASVELVWRA